MIELQDYDLQGAFSKQNRIISFEAYPYTEDTVNTVQVRNEVGGGRIRLCVNLHYKHPLVDVGESSWLKSF